MPRLSYLVVVILLGAGCSAGPHQSTAAITATASSCAAGWRAQPAGHEHFTVRNTGEISTRVTLIDATTGGIYGQVWQLSGGTSRPLDVIVPAGNYRWRCIPKTGRATISAAKTVRGKGGRGAKPLLPLSSEEINDAMSQYHTAVGQGIGKLLAATDGLRTAVDAGQLNLARQRWLAAHLEYERLGAAYGTFGALDGLIDGRPDGLPDGVHDRNFTGFLRVEYGLWHGESAKSLTPAVTALEANVRKLAVQFPKLQIVPSDIPLRAHEILENTLQFELTGDTDMGSHTNLATAQANTDGSIMVLGVLTQQLRIRDGSLETTCSRELTAFRRQLGQYEQNGRWEPLNSLRWSQREQLNAALGQLLENLALIPNILQMPPSTAPT